MLKFRHRYLWLYKWFGFLDVVLDNFRERRPSLQLSSRDGLMSHRPRSFNPLAGGAHGQGLLIPQAAAEERYEPKHDVHNKNWRAFLQNMGVKSLITCIDA